MTERETNIYQQISEKYDLKIAKKCSNTDLKVQFSCPDYKKYDLAINFNSKYNLMVIWNLKCNIYNRSQTLNLKNSWKELSETVNIVDIITKWMGNKVNSPEEDVIIATYDYIEYDSDIIKNLFYDKNIIDQYLSIDLLKEDNKSLAERKRHLVNVLNRKYKFRENVLNKYNYKCAICGCDIKECLEAAHIHGHEVKEDNDDSTENGICLCRIHHILYDRKYIDISLSEKGFYENKILLQSSWYCQFKKIGNDINI